MKVLEFDNYQDWLSKRGLGIGGSDVAAICGLSPWKNAYGVWLEKTKRLEPIPMTPAMRAGIMLEDTVAQWFSQETGWELEKSNGIIQHDQYEFIIGNVDRWITDFPALLECKTTSWRNAAQWENAVPEHYQLQVMHYLAITGYETAWIAVLIAGDDFRKYEMKRDEETIQALIKIECDFWKKIQSKTPPSNDPPISISSIVNRLKVQSSDLPQIELSDEDFRLISERKKYNAAKKALEEEIERIEDTLKLKLSEPGIGLFQGQEVLSWKEYEVDRIDSKKFKAEQFELWKQYCKTAKQRRLNFK